MHWAENYLGVPWSPTGEGGACFHCWSFTRHVLRQHFGLEVPAVAYSDDVVELARLFRDHPERQRWLEVERPADGDVVLMRRNRVPIHVGIWLSVNRGGVLHCQRGDGVVFMSVADLAVNGWMVHGFYRFNGGGDGTSHSGQQSL